MNNGNLSSDSYKEWTRRRQNGDYKLQLKGIHAFSRRNAEESLFIFKRNEIPLNKLRCTIQDRRKFTIFWYYN